MANGCDGGHLAPEHPVGRVTFAQFLAEQFAAGGGPAAGPGCGGPA